MPMYQVLIFGEIKVEMWQDFHILSILRHNFRVNMVLVCGKKIFLWQIKKADIGIAYQCPSM